MNMHNLKKYEGELQEERVKLLAELEKGSRPQDFGSDVDALDEEADEAEDLGNAVALNQVLKERVEEIDVALGKISNGTYGACESCGKSISEEVLAAMPSSRYCKDCKSKQR
ncbi:hypothetical protein C4571_03010 [Candidatus Parcubacteria bacterium]|nr:MAG: hypothetical protein C4571_03010 [Candidatus Parcubacteria bacterium]